MTHEEFLRSLATRYHNAMRGQGDPSGRGPLPSAYLRGDAWSEAVGRWLAWHVALYFQRCPDVSIENCTTWQYWGRHEREDIDWTVLRGACGGHRSHPFETRLKTFVMRHSAGRYLCEIHDWTSRVIERTIGAMHEQAEKVIILDVFASTRQHMGRIRWRALDRPTLAALSLAGSSDVESAPNFGMPAPATTTGQGQGEAVAALVQVGSERANSASLQYRIDAELNRLGPEIQFLAPRPGQGVLAVVDTETQRHGSLMGRSFLGCHLAGVFDSPHEGLAEFEDRGPGLWAGTRGGGQAVRQFYWGVLE